MPSRKSHFGEMSKNVKVMIVVGAVGLVVIGIVISIMIKKKYTVALKTDRIDHSKFMPYFLTED